MLETHIPSPGCANERHSHLDSTDDEAKKQGQCIFYSEETDGNSSRDSHTQGPETVMVTVLVAALGDWDLS